MRLKSFFVAVVVAQEHEDEYDFGGPPRMTPMMEDYDYEIDGIPYTPYTFPNAHFYESFENASDFSSWVVSEGEQYGGSWKRTKRRKEALIDDYALQMVDPFQFHAISHKMPKWDFSENVSLVVGYEVHAEDGDDCSGMYMKLFDSEGGLHTFSKHTRYTIMFGPDRCGATDQVHLIIQYQHPDTKKWVEYHLETPPQVPFEKGSHAYMLVLDQMNNYAIFVDRELVISGHLLEGFEPSFSVPNKIKDPDDIKPADWDERPTIHDPNQTPREEWDDREFIKETEKPEDWDDDTPEFLQIDDDEWIPNPACDDKCGLWIPRDIPNPDYMGKWIIKWIPNPDYSGRYAYRMVDNPDWFDARHVAKMLHSVDAIGFELWTVQGSVLFDNVFVAKSVEVGMAIQEIWAARRELENSAVRIPTVEHQHTFTDTVMELATLHPYQFSLAIGGCVAMSFLTLLRCCGRGSGETRKVGETDSKAEEPVVEEKEGSAEEKTQEKEKGENGSTARRRK